MLEFAKNNNTNKKVISISKKRQVTIPQKFFEYLNFGNQAECILEEDRIIIRPLSESGSDFSECILKDLIKEGYEGEELLLKFKEMKKKIRPAVKELIKEADELAKSDEGEVSFDELFGEDWYIVYRLKYSTASRKYFKKINEKGLKKSFENALKSIQENPYIGKPKKGDLSGIYGYDVFYNKTN